MAAGRWELEKGEETYKVVRETAGRGTTGSYFPARNVDGIWDGQLMFVVEKIHFGEAAENVGGLRLLGEGEWAREIRGWIE